MTLSYSKHKENVGPNLGLTSMSSSCCLSFFFLVWKFLYFTCISLFLNIFIGVELLYNGALASALGELLNWPKSSK